MNTQRPVNTFRTNSPQQPRPKLTQPVPERTYTNERGSTRTDTSRWRQTRGFMRERPLLESTYRFCVKLFLWIFFGSLGYVIVLKYVPVLVTPLIISRWV